MFIHYENNDVCCWDTSTAQVVKKISLGANIEWVKVLDKSILSIDKQNVLNIWDIEGEKIKRTYQIPNNNYLFGMQAYPMVEAPTGKIYIGFPFKIIRLDPRFTSLSLAILINMDINKGPYASDEDAHIKRTPDFIFEICDKFLISEYSKKHVYVFDTITKTRKLYKAEDCFSTIVDEIPHLIVKWKKSIVLINLLDGKYTKTKWECSLEAVKRFLDEKKVELCQLVNFSITNTHTKTVVGMEGNSGAVVESTTHYYSKMLTQPVRKATGRNIGLAVEETLELSENTKIHRINDLYLINKLKSPFFSGLFGLYSENIIWECTPKRTIIHKLPTCWNNAQLSTDGLYYNYILSGNRKVGVRFIDIEGSLTNGVILKKIKSVFTSIRK